MKSRIESYGLGEVIGISKIRKIFTNTELEEAFEMLTEYLSQRNYVLDRNYTKGHFWDKYPPYLQEHDNLYGHIFTISRSGLFDIPESVEVYVTLSYRPYEVQDSRHYPKVVDGVLSIRANLNTHTLPRDDSTGGDLLWESYSDMPKEYKAKLAKFLNTVESFVEFYKEIKKVRISKDRRNVHEYKKITKSKPKEFMFRADNLELARRWKTEQPFRYGSVRTSN